MCGIVASIKLGSRSHPSTNGYLTPPKDRHPQTSEGETKPYECPPETLETKLRNSLDRISHRGPDASDVWLSSDERIGLGHCRLSINDLSPHGNQPIHSDDGTIHAVVNGEIYDESDALRGLLEREYGYVFGSHSDSELVVALYKVYGAPDFLRHLRGEFAFVLYDERIDTVIVARDRFGIKPLFWTVLGDNSGNGNGGTSGEELRLLVAAEAKAFLPLGWQPRWDVRSIADGGWMHDDRTSFRGVKKVLPGHWMQVSGDGLIQDRQYWDIDYKDKREEETRTMEEMILGVRERLVEAIRIRMRADVPVGVYLSGGIDSSVVAGIASQLVKEKGLKMGDRDSSKKIACFTIQFPHESGWDESDIAQRTADFLGVQLLRQKVNEAELAGNFADSAYHCEHHNFDLNSVGKFTLSKLPREHGFKVVLTGEGSDEHFAGYPWFAAEILRDNDHAMAAGGHGLTVDPERRVDMLAQMDGTIRGMIPHVGMFNHSHEASAATRAVDNSTILPATLLWQPTIGMFAPWVRRTAAAEDLDCRDTVVRALSGRVRNKILDNWHPLHSAEYVFSRSILANILLSCLGDRTEMAHSIEARVPFLDHNLSEYVNSLPPSVKVAHVPEAADTERDQGPFWQDADRTRRTLSEKWILREAGKPFISKELYERKKHPYLAPMKWPIGGPLHRKMSEILSRPAVEKVGFLDWEATDDALRRGFGDNADPLCFRTVLVAASLVVLGQRFGIPSATADDWQ